MWVFICKVCAIGTSMPLAYKSMHRKRYLYRMLIILVIVIWMFIIIFKQLR